MEKILQFVKKYKLLFLITIVAIVGIIITIYFLTRPPRTTIENYNEFSSAPSSAKAGLEEQLYRFLNSHHENANELKDVYIRKGSYQKTNDDQLSSEVFLIDIDSLKITYQISNTWSKGTPVPDGIIIDCPAISDSKYPDTNCVGMYNNSNEMKILAKFPLIKELPIVVDEYVNNYSEYINYKITYTEDLSNLTAIITITDLSGGNHDRALKKISELGFNPADYDIKYLDQSSENYWPRVTKY